MTVGRSDLPGFVLEAFEAGVDGERALAEAVGALASALAPTPPSATARSRLMAAVASGPERYAPFFSRLGQLLDVGAERVRVIFGEAEDPGRWKSPGLPGMAQFHFEAGPALAGADAGLIRLEPGTAFPEHVHLGSERVLLLAGAYRDSEGRVFRAGDTHEMAAGSRHSYVVLLDAPCLFCVVLDAGITIGGERFG